MKEGAMQAAQSETPLKRTIGISLSTSYRRMQTDTVTVTGNPRKLRALNFPAEAKGETRTQKKVLWLIANLKETVTPAEQHHLRTLER
jgi:hypothetical protein